MMINPTRMIVTVFAVALAFLFLTTAGYAEGISVDAGLTPGEDRYIIRLQMRYMESGHDPTGMDREMKMYAYPFIMVYGLKPELTVMAKYVHLTREMDSMMMDTSDSGSGDFFVMSKYRLYRVNEPTYTFGVASTLGIELPTGDPEFTSDTYDMHAGLFASYRRGPLAVDINGAYVWNRFSNHSSDIYPGDEFNFDLATGYQFSLSDSGRASIAPVAELNFKSVWPDRMDGHKIPNTGGDVLIAAPGIKFTTTWIVFEGLVQFPIWQDQRDDGLERGVSGLLGIRLLF
jgi:outer membrane putative beta-barrel porin/alpha-amylase